MIAISRIPLLLCLLLQILCCDFDWASRISCNGLSLTTTSITTTKSSKKKKTKIASSNWSKQQHQIVSNLFSICIHLQNPKLYDLTDCVANACHYDVSSQMLFTSKDVRRGEILSLLPIHAVGLKSKKKMQQQGNGNVDSYCNGHDCDWMVYDRDQDDVVSNFVLQQRRQGNKSSFASTTTITTHPPYHWTRYDMSDFVEVPQTTTHILPIDIYNAMYCYVNPNHPLQNGWIGHLARPVKPPPDDHETSTTDSQYLSANCCILAMAPPICGLFVTKDIPAGTPLVVQTNKIEKDERSTASFFFNYRQEIEELQKLLDMAYPTKEEEKEAGELQHATATSSSTFYNFPRNYQNLIPVHNNPDIFTVPNFLSKEECDMLIDKATPNLVPCLTQNSISGEVETDSSRTSFNANIAQSEIPTIVGKLCKLANCTSDHLEILQVLKYTSGQYFKEHTDGFSGPATACGFSNSARLVTIFCYLNTVSKGGETRFGKLNLNLQPFQGTAVIHFPTSLDFEEDTRTIHEGMPAIDDKWVLVTWIWMHPRDQRSIYAEKWLEPIDDDWEI